VAADETPTAEPSPCTACRATGKVIDVSGGSLANGANVIEWTDNGGTNQQWQIVVSN